jgi:NADH dehydrogenase
VTVAKTRRQARVRPARHATEQAAAGTAAALQASIVIVGGGAGGLELAAKLGRKLGRGDPGRVLLIDRAPVHVWKPTLHEVAAGTLNAHAEGLSYAVLARRNHFSFALGELCGLDAAAQRLSLAALNDEAGQPIVPQREVGFDRLVLALGCGSNDFNTPGFEHAYVLERLSDAEHFRQRLLAGFMRAAFAPNKTMSLAIVGAGATGVELAAELTEAHDEVQQSISPALRFKLDVAIVEAAPRILAGLSERVSKQAALALQKRQIRVLTGTKVLEVRADGLVTSAGDVPAHMVVWAARLQAARSNASLGLATNRQHQFVVDDQLRTSAPNVYALGDCAACPWRDGELVPARAQAAHQQAQYLLRTLAAAGGSAAQRAPFVYRDFGSLLSLGENRGIGTLMSSLSRHNFFVDGLLARWMYMSLHLLHHRAILGVPATVVLALMRLAQRRISGRVKLH